ncbi:MAG TPA: VWA domain-containing protein, partial [Planctomycetota bacterium]|nr:VWA domain-containing protein [Planctomycetota bacterium]
DHLALATLVDQLATVPRNTEEDRTGIGLAVARGARVLRASTARSKVMILLTDGQENVNEVSPAEGGKLAKTFGVKVYTIGAGLGVRYPFGGMQAIDFSEVRSLAEETGGRFYHAGDARALTSTYEEIDRLERSDLEDPRVHLDERFLWLLVPALASFAIAALLEASWLQAIP